MAGLSPQQEKFFLFLTRFSVGDVVSKADILKASGWSESTFRTYLGKNYMDPFLARTDRDGKYRVLRDGNSIFRGEVASAFTQTRPELFVPIRGRVLRGNRGRYILDHEIGRGAVARVWDAKFQNEEQCAVKIMDPRQDLLDPDVLDNVRQRFVRESRNGIKLRHANVVRCRDVGEIGSHPFLVMDRAQHSLESRLTAGVMDLRESLHVVECCLSGLKYIHSADCVHRDIKPGNILKIGNQWVLGDLGIVRWSDMNKEFTSAAAITRSSVQLGSWYYMAPEQREDPHDVDSRSDVYSLGITWYEMLTGRVPDPTAVGARALAPPTKIDVVDELIVEMISYSAGSRPTVAAMIRRIGRFAESRSG